MLGAPMLPSRFPSCRALVCAVMLAALNVSCGGNDAPIGPSGSPAAIAAVSATLQSGTAGSSVTTRPSVRVTDADGAPVQRVIVIFAVSAGGGTLSGASQTTNGSGEATVGSWTLGTVAGANSLTATVSGLPPVVFEASGAPGAAARLIESAGNGQTAPAATALAIPPAVRVTDVHGNAVIGVAVSFTPSAGSGTVGGGAATSDAGGNAAAQSWTLGPSAGTHSLTATALVIPGAAVPFSATATPNATITGMVSTASERQSFALSRGLLRPLEGDRATPAASWKQETPQAVIAIDGGGGVTAMSSTDSRHPEIVPGSLIVTFNSVELGAPNLRSRAYASPGTAKVVAKEMSARLESAAPALGARVEGMSPAILAARLSVASERVDEVRARLLADRSIASVEPEKMLYATRLPARPSPVLAAEPVIPNDPLYNPQSWHYGMIDLPRAWTLTTGSASVLVAVVDDGVRFDHPAISANLTTDGYDFVSQRTTSVCGTERDNAGDGDGYDRDPTSPAQYDCSTGGLHPLGVHGLHVAGTIGAAGDDGIGVTGVSWRVRIRPVRVLGVAGFGTTYDVAQGILYAAGLPADDGAGGQVQASSGARIINLSLGGDASTAVQNAIEAAASAGVLIVAAAGNAASTDPFYPAAYPQVLSVSAVGPDGELASYSNYGPTIGIAAPGGDFADGDGTFGVASAVWDFAMGRPQYAYYNGTSMAAPHVSGVAALLLAREPALTGAQLAERLTSFAVDAGAPGPDIQYGAGIVNARNSLTRSHAPRAERYASLYDVVTGRLLRTQRVDGDGTYRFAATENGIFFVFAGEDEEGDAAVGRPGRRWGAFGTSVMQPGVVTVSGAGTYAAPIVIQSPLEAEPNDDLATAGQLVLESYVNGVLSQGDVDVYRITVPAGQYTFTTSGWVGACAYAKEADTGLELLLESGALRARSDDIDRDGRNFCSRITESLDAGTYFLRVLRHRSGRYRLEARAGV